MPAVLRGLRGWVVVATLLVAVLAVVWVLPHAVLFTRPLERASTERDVSSRSYAEVTEFTAGGRTAQVSIEVFREWSGEYRIRVAVAQPDPRLHSLDVRFRTMAAPSLPSAALRLEAPGGDWPPMRFETTSEGDQRFAADGIDGHTTIVDFYLPEERAEELPEELGVDLAFDLRSPPSLSSWEATTHVSLPLAGLDER